ncbi:MAG TPA: hypothetical protein VFQ76_08210 [Longimicrobiaceae bacterium]|nr:hypothetical protein [Longimicrobiaceae bacterium]
MSTSIRMGALAALLFVAACGDARGGADPVAVRDSAGIRIVASEAPAWAEGEGWRLSAEPVLVAVGHSFGPGAVADGVRRDSIDYLRYSADGVLLDTLAVLASGESFVKTGFGAFGFTTAPLLFGKNAVHGQVGDRVVVGSNHAYELAVYSPEGTLERLIRREQDPRPVTGRDFEAAVAASLDGMDAEWRDRMEAVYEAMPRPATMPFYSALLVDDGENLWVKDFEVPPDRASTWTVFDPRGRMLGGVAVPDRFRPTHIGADFVLGVWQDELDVQYVQMFALEKGGRRR